MGGIDQRAGQVGQRPEEVRRTGRLHPFLDVAEHDGADGDADEVLNQRIALADVAGQREAGLQGVEGVVELPFAQFQAKRASQEGGERAQVLNVVKGKVEILQFERGKLPIAVVAMGRLVGEAKAMAKLAR